MSDKPKRVDPVQAAVDRQLNMAVKNLLLAAENAKIAFTLAMPFTSDFVQVQGTRPKMSRATMVASLGEMVHNAIIEELIAQGILKPPPPAAQDSEGEDAGNIITP